MSVHLYQYSKQRSCLLFFRMPNQKQFFALYVKVKLSKYFCSWSLTDDIKFPISPCLKLELQSNFFKSSGYQPCYIAQLQFKSRINFVCKTFLMALAFQAKHKRFQRLFLQVRLNKTENVQKKCRILQIILKNGLMHKPSNFGFYCCPQKCLRNFMMKLSIVSSQVSSQKFYSKKVLPLPY